MNKEFVEVAKSIYERCGYLTKTVLDEDVFVRNTLRPFVILDMGYSLFQDVDQEKVVRDMKKWYSKEKEAWQKSYKCFHRGMTEEQIFLISDYEEAMAEQVKDATDKLISIADGCLKDFNESYRREIALVFVSEAIAFMGIEFIDCGFKLHRIHETKTATSKGRFNIRGNQTLMKRNDLHNMCDQLNLVVKNSERLQYEMRKHANGGRAAEDVRFGDNEDFMKAFNEFLKSYNEAVI